ncbi:MAG: SIR2 family protein [Ghiorsea sp.]|nr:SIR2 family protein [Ghiorsea sp.]
MAKIVKFSGDINGEVADFLTSRFQSGHINFLIGSGASLPAISVAGNVEAEAHALFETGQEQDGEKKLAELLNSVNGPTNDLIQSNANQDVTDTLTNYKKFIEFIEQILLERKTNILAKQVTIFTTNYDLFIEAAAENFPSLILNDGFDRKPNLSGKAVYSTRKFFDTVYHRGPLYNYVTEIPSINLIKLHGSLSWSKDTDDLTYAIKETELLTDEELNDAENVSSYLNKHDLILPHKGKFHETLMGRTYYDLLRIYSNELDKENSLLIAFGFSFVDEHIYDLTQRVLKNPSLILVIFAFNEEAKNGYAEKFARFSNVTIIAAQDEVIDFSRFNQILTSSIPKRQDIKNGG